MPNPANTSTIPASRRTYKRRGMSHADTVQYELERVRRDGDCLISHRPQHATGYVYATIGGTQVRIHRAVLEDKIGRPLQRPEMALHTCHRRNCINPDHLYVGDHNQNMRDKVEAGRQAIMTGEEHPNSLLTDSSVRELRRRYAAGGITQENLAREYGIDQTTVSDIVRRRSWKHL